MRKTSLALALCISSFANAGAIDWPNGQQAAVSLSYDDALNSQLDNVAPALARYDLKVSFYPTLSSEVIAERMDEWRALAEQGHELGNHTLFHSCRASQPGMDWVAPHNDLDKRPVAQMQAEVTTANSFLHAIDGRDRRTMTPPCLHHQASNGDYIAAVQDQFVAIKGAETLPEDLTPSMMPAGKTGEELIAFVKEAGQSGGVVNIIFHGIGGDHLSNSVKAHNELLKFLDDNRDTYWTDTYLDIMTHATEQ